VAANALVGLSLELRAEQEGNQLRYWMQPLQTLSGIPCHVRVQWVGRIDRSDHPCITQWLKQLGQSIGHLTVEVHVSNVRLKLKEFSEAAAPCRAIDLTVWHAYEVVDLADLEPVAGSLHCLVCEPSDWRHGILRGASAFSSMSRLTTLHLERESFGSEEPWGVLAKLTSLQHLSLGVRAIGDASPLSEVTRLSSLHLQSVWHEGDGPVPFSLSSLQPLSTLQQLEELYLWDHACAATSLQGLAGLSNLKVLELEFDYFGSKLRTLEGISPAVVQLTATDAPDLVSLAGIEGCASMKKLTLNRCGVSSLQSLQGLGSLEQLEISGCGLLANLEGLNSVSLQSLHVTDCSSLTQLSGVEHLSALKSLKVMHCAVTSLQPLSQLGEGLQKLRVEWCYGVREEVLELPNVQPTADVNVKESNVKDVVLAGGVRWTRST
jgi:hypothetical protein